MLTGALYTHFCMFALCSINQLEIHTKKGGADTGKEETGRGRHFSFFFLSRHHLPVVPLFCFLQVLVVGLLLLVPFSPALTACLPGLLTSAAAVTAFWS